MKSKSQTFTSQQLLFKELFVGALIYAVVLGFLNDYTNIVYAKSFSWIFYASIVLELLTILAFMIKNRIVKWLKNRDGAIYKLLMFICVWLVMFVSKFVFVWVIDLLFGANITIYGFFGILLVVASVTVVHTVADKVFIKLGNAQ